MFSLKKVMTEKEAQCFWALRRWQRAYLKRRFVDTLKPQVPFASTFVKANIAGKLLLGLVITLLLPLIVLVWLIKLVIFSVLMPFLILVSYFRPPGLRAPGERNLKGVHYQFARHINLPPDLYIRCVDEWVAILYGREKLPRFSLANYLDADYMMRRQIAYAKDSSLQQLLKTQISNAREDLSRDLGHY